MKSHAVCSWLDLTSLDSIGLAGFSHDFQATTNQDTDVTQMFHSVAGNPTRLARLVALLALEAGRVLAVSLGVKEERQGRGHERQDQGHEHEHGERASVENSRSETDVEDNEFYQTTVAVNTSP